MTALDYAVQAIMQDPNRNNIEGVLLWFADRIQPKNGISAVARALSLSVVRTRDVVWKYEVGQMIDGRLLLSDEEMDFLMDKQTEYRLDKRRENPFYNRPALQPYPSNLTFKDVAEIVGLNVRQVQVLHQQKKLPARKIRGVHYVWLADMDRMFARGILPTSPEALEKVRDLKVLDRAGVREYNAEGGIDANEDLS